jgi:hypothetical protein
MQTAAACRPLSLFPGFSQGEFAELVNLMEKYG